MGLDAWTRFLEQPLSRKALQEEKDRNGKVSMVHAALEAWVIKPSRRVLRVLFR